MPGFDVGKFMAERFALRTASVKVPELAAMFGDGEDPVFAVRGLDGNEWGLAQEAVKKRRDLAKVMGQIASGNAEKVGEAVKETLGLNDKLAVEDALRMEAFIHGVVSPAMTDTERLDVAKRMHRYFYDAFKRVTDKILTLTGASDQGEASDSGPTPTSGSH